MMFSGTLTNCRRPLASAAQMLNAGRIAFMDKDGGLVIPDTSAFGRELTECYYRLLEKYGVTGCLPLYKEKQVYNFYLRLKSPPAGQQGSAWAKGKNTVPNFIPVQKGTTMISYQQPRSVSSPPAPSSGGRRHP